MCHESGSWALSVGLHGGGGSIRLHGWMFFAASWKILLLAFAILPASTRSKGRPNSMNCHQDGNPGVRGSRGLSTSTYNPYEDTWAWFMAYRAYRPSTNPRYS